MATNKSCRKDEFNWSSYKKAPRKIAPPVEAEWAERSKVEAHFVHSGGHAWPENLKRLAGALGARETIWVHTDCNSSGVSPSPPQGR